MTKSKIKYLLSDEHSELRRDFLDVLQGKSQYVRIGHRIQGGLDFKKWTYNLYPLDVLWKALYEDQELIIFRDEQVIHKENELNFHSFMVNEQGIFLIFEQDDASLLLRQLNHDGKFVNQITLNRTDKHSTLYEALICKDYILFLCCGKDSCFILYDTISGKYETIFHEYASSVDKACVDDFKIYYTLTVGDDRSDSGSSMNNDDEDLSFPRDVYCLNVIDGSNKLITSFHDKINAIFVWQSGLYVNSDNKLWLIQDDKKLIRDNLILLDENYQQQGDYIVSKVMSRYYSVVKMSNDQIFIDPHVVKVYCKKMNAIDCPNNLLINSSYYDSIVSGRWKDDKIILPFRMKIIKNWITAMTTYDPSLKCLIHAMMCQDFLCQDEVKKTILYRILVEVCMSKKKFIKILTKYQQEVIDMLKDVLVIGMDVHKKDLNEQDYELICNHPYLVMKNHQGVCPLIQDSIYDAEQYTCNVYGIIVNK
jgi:hypothetical protein